MRIIAILLGSMAFSTTCFCSEPLGQIVHQAQMDDSISKIEKLASFVAVSFTKVDSISYKNQYDKKKWQAVLNCAYNFGGESVQQKAVQLSEKYGLRLSRLTLPVSFSDEELLVWKIQKCFDGIRKIDSDSVLSPTAVKVFTHVDGDRLRKDSPFEFLVQVLQWIQSMEEENTLASKALSFIRERTSLALGNVEECLSSNFRQLAKKKKVEDFLTKRIQLLNNVQEQDRKKGD